MSPLSEMSEHPPGRPVGVDCSWCGSPVGHLASCDLLQQWQAIYWSTRKMVAGPSLFRRGSFELAGGGLSGWKIECDALTEEDWETLAWLLAQHLVPFGAVRGVPMGGEPFAKALKQYTTPESDVLLIVDDVWTTGTSMLRYENELLSATAPEQIPPIIRAVAFARGYVPSYVSAVFKLAPEIKQ